VSTATGDEDRSRVSHGEFRSCRNLPSASWTTCGLNGSEAGSLLSFDDEHWFGAPRTARLTACHKLLWGRHGAEECAAAQQRFGSSAVGEKTEVADADQPPGQNVDEEGSQELICGDGQDLLLAAARVVLPAEGDSILLECHEAMVGNGDTVSVAG
jgi:hypothetical protein